MDDDRRYENPGSEGGPYHLRTISPISLPCISVALIPPLSEGQHRTSQVDAVMVEKSLEA